MWQCCHPNNGDNIWKVGCKKVFDWFEALSSDEQKLREKPKDCRCPDGADLKTASECATKYASCCDCKSKFINEPHCADKAAECNCLCGKPQINLPACAAEKAVCGNALLEYQQSNSNEFAYRFRDVLCTESVDEINTGGSNLGQTLA